MSKGLELEISVTAATPAAVLRFVRTKLLAAHAMLRPALMDLSIAFVGDRRMAGLHLRFMNIPGPTDVLTFPLKTNRFGHAVSGEIIICVPEAARRARQNRGKLRDELLLYGLHGMLHLCGFDDKTDAGFLKMHRKEDEILSLLGVGRVFDRG